ncbi:MAG: Gfo/Idh/MocA family oxidoreductase [Deltaproteobacteria bacterium]|nr:Gfo/Idh/MocA family oxidoreductase [Deltaproteobacteria bacterium]
MRLAVVGAGYWGPNLVRNLLTIPDVSVIVCERDPKRLLQVKERFPSVEVTSDYDAVLGDTSIAGVLLATPISTHGPLGVRALGAGKHLFVEKPLAGSVSDAEALVTEAERRGRVLMVGHTFEYSPPIVKIRDVIERGELGPIYFISMTRVNLGLHQRDASVIWDLAPHDFSILFHWLQEGPKRVTAIGRACVQPGIPDVAFVSLEFPSGVVANVEVAWLAPSKIRKTTIVGQKKMLAYDDTQNIEAVKIYDQGVDFRDPETFGEYQLSYRTGDIVSPRISGAEPLKVEMSHFVECIQGNKTPRSDGRSGLRVVRALEAAERSLRSRAPVEIESR